jgi:predicted O-methyltransferase YrrM
MKDRLQLALRNPAHALEYALRRAIPFGIRFKDRDAYRISTWRHGRLERRRPAEIFPGIEHVDVRLFNLYDRDPGMSIDAAEVMVLCAIERFIRAENVLEIGTWDGNTALNLAANVADGGRVTTVDLPPDARLPSGYWNKAEPSRVGVQYRGSPYESRIRQVLGDSRTMNWEELGGPFDLIFIDGCHAEEYVRTDTENALRRIRPGGVIVWHDYGDFKSVSRAVDGLIGGSHHAAAVRSTRFAVARF